MHHYPVRGLSPARAHRKPHSLATPGRYRGWVCADARQKACLRRQVVSATIQTLSFQGLRFRNGGCRPCLGGRGGHRGGQRTISGSWRRVCTSGSGRSASCCSAHDPPTCLEQCVSLVRGFSGSRACLCVQINRCPAVTSPGCLLCPCLSIPVCGASAPGNRWGSDGQHGTTDVLP